MFLTERKKKRKKKLRTNEFICHDCQNSLLIVNYQRLFDNHLYMYRYTYIYIDNKIE